MCLTLYSLITGSQHTKAQISQVHNIQPWKLIDGLFVLYPMHVPSREREKNPLVINKLKAEHKHFLDIAPEKPG